MRHQSPRFDLLFFLAALGSVGCGETECANGCPKPSTDLADGDVRLEFVTESAFALLAPDGDAAVMAGELVLHPEQPGCIASSTRPCPATVRRLSFRISDLTLGESRIEHPTLSLAEPIDLVDTGFGLVIPEKTSVRSCVRLDGNEQGTVGPSPSAVSMNYDDSVTPHVASIQTTWSLEYADPSNDCGSKRLDVTLLATAEGE
jgi:hypothetical protein